jgi:rubrerythrin
MSLSVEEITQIAQKSAQTVLEGLHRYAVDYKEPATVEQGLQDSMVEEKTAADWYRRRAKNAADLHVDGETMALYQDIAVDEDEHYDRFQKRLQQLQGELQALKHQSPKGRYLVVDNEFNRANYPSLIGQLMASPPAYATVQFVEEGEPVRDIASAEHIEYVRTGGYTPPTVTGHPRHLRQDGIWGYAKVGETEVRARRLLGNDLDFEKISSSYDREEFDEAVEMLKAFFGV